MGEIQIRVLGKGDEGVLGHVAEGVFDFAVVPALAAEFLADRRHHLVVAMEGELVVGMISAVSHLHPDKPVELWIKEVGVARQYQGRGIGKRMMQAVLEEGRRLGCEEAWVLTDTDNAVAVRLYEGSGGRRLEQLMFMYDLKRRQGGA